MTVGAEAGGVTGGVTGGGVVLSEVSGVASGAGAALVGVAGEGAA